MGHFRSNYPRLVNANANVNPNVNANANVNPARGQAFNLNANEARADNKVVNGDPMSPYLFTLVMEVLTAILQQATSIDSSFRFHRNCEKQRIVNLCFADDLFLFARGDVQSVKIIMDSINMFKDLSGLVPSMPKSTAFFCNVSMGIKRSILNIMSFEEGSLPVKYLGVSLIATRLLLQLIISVLSSFYIYWASVFVLPISIIRELEQKMRDFLWSQGALSKGKAKVAWKTELTLGAVDPCLSVKRKKLMGDSHAKQHMLELEKIAIDQDHNKRVSMDRYKKWCKHIVMIWSSVRKKVRLTHLQCKWEDIVNWLIPRASSKSAHIVTAKLILVATAYYIWQERNARFFKNQLRPPEKVEEIIVETIRLKLYSFKFKKTDRVRRLLEEWKIASADVIVDD
ncbi:uncharacterized protein LOC110882191 [Helianthus annuus]|uniref:uncharacterized protein LOC110882191 n=1 Tax=Helianthus annuus TaxID=4232 RepID=UPI000B8F58AE|nr:uncharacterized protein LOC110882191 [Helianthus annuus]